MNGRGRARRPGHLTHTQPPHHKATGSEGSTAQLEARTFLEGARRWIDQGLAGDIGAAEAAAAAQMLCARAEQMALAA